MAPASTATGIRCRQAARVPALAGPRSRHDHSLSVPTCRGSSQSSRRNALACPACTPPAHTSIVSRISVQAVPKADEPTGRLELSGLEGDMSLSHRARRWALTAAVAVGMVVAGSTAASASSNSSANTRSRSASSSKLVEAVITAFTGPGILHRRRAFGGGLSGRLRDQQGRRCPRARLLGDDRRHARRPCRRAASGRAVPRLREQCRRRLRYRRRDRQPVATADQRAQAHDDF